MAFATRAVEEQAKITWPNLSKLSMPQLPIGKGVKGWGDLNFLRATTSSDSSTCSGTTPSNSPTSSESPSDYEHSPRASIFGSRQLDEDFEYPLPSKDVDKIGKKNSVEKDGGLGLGSDCRSGNEKVASKPAHDFHTWTLPLGDFREDMFCDGSESLGLVLSSGKALMVKQVSSGSLLNAWNKTFPEQAIKPGDEIVAVNGGSGSAKELVHRLKNNPRSITFRYISEYSVSLTRADRNGSDIGLMLHPTLLLVLGITSMSSVDLHNKQVAPDFRVDVGDRLLSANSICDPKEILRELKRSDEVVLKFERTRELDV
eukprot:gb/GFBE01009886.1/.p1 GENE.gb/GFBE01009886.1/~~gb/GFBE01009886.1/.p1  ORF type:complete len:315 (+),score=53.86 gb/GFBE01009886.1/:1-945(+)